MVIGVYAACKDSSAAGAAQVQDIARMQASKDNNTAKIAKGKNAHTMLLHDLEVEINKLRRVYEGCMVIVGGDFNQRKGGKGKGWEQLCRARGDINRHFFSKNRTDEMRMRSGLCAQ